MLKWSVFIIKVFIVVQVFLKRNNVPQRAQSSPVCCPMLHLQCLNSLYFEHAAQVLYFLFFLPLLASLVQEKNFWCHLPALYPSFIVEQSAFHVLLLLLLLLCVCVCVCVVICILRFSLHSCPWHFILSDVRPWLIKWCGKCFSRCWDRILCRKGKYICILHPINYYIIHRIFLDNVM